MGRAKTRVMKKEFGKKTNDDSASADGVPIPNLPPKYPLMHVKSGSKIRNILQYALKEFPVYGHIIFKAAGQGIGKAISCAEIFKRKHQGLHQINKLRYIVSKASKKEQTEPKNADKNTRSINNKEKLNMVPEIHILLAKEIKDTNELGYQSPGNRGEFSLSQETSRSEIGGEQTSASNVTCIDAKEFAAMGLRTGQKRSKKDDETEATPRKKNKGKVNSKK